MAAIYHNDVVDIDLEKGTIHRAFLNHTIGSGDNNANWFGVKVYRNGEPVTLTGCSVQGLFMPSVGSAILISDGTHTWVNDNEASVLLPQACYNVKGRFTLAIKIIGTNSYSITDTVRIVDGIVADTNSESPVAPTASVPTYQEILSVYNQMVAVKEGSVLFNSAQSLTDGQKAQARGNIAAASAAEVSDLNSAITQINSNIESLAENGYYDTGGSQPEDIYLTMESGWIDRSGNVQTDNQKGYIWLTSEQEALSLKIDTSVFTYNLCYMNGSSVAKYTGWLSTSPIEFDDTAHTQIGITVKKIDTSRIDNILDQILYYTSGQTEIGNLATKDYAIAKQQSKSDSGKILGIGEDGIVVPVMQPEVVEVDATLSVEGDAADAKATGDRIEELSENGYYAIRMESHYIPLTSGMIYQNKEIQTASDTGYVLLTSAEETKQIEFDTTKYKYNFAFFNGATSTYWTTWITSSPIIIDPSIDHTEAYINVRKLSGSMSSDDLSTALHYSDVQTFGNLATKQYVDQKIDVDPNISKGTKCIYPDGFISRIKPDIYFNGSYYADINSDDYKQVGIGEVWVATNGNDTTGNGSESNPYATITKALTVSAITIHVKEGNYTQGTHYKSSCYLGGKNVIGHGTVVFQNDSSGHYVSASSSAYIENITFKHGHPTIGPAFGASCTTSGKKICFVKCTFCDGGTNGLSLEGIDAVLFDCISYGSRYDGFNYHSRTLQGTTYIPNVLEVNCKAYNNGSSQSGSDSCNGSTAHDGARIIRLNGEYYSCYGGVIAEIGLVNEDPTISVNYGVLAHDSTGTGAYKASFWASVNTKMYLYDCASYGGTYDISAINDAKIVSWRLTTGRDEPSINEASTATVIQH